MIPSNNPITFHIKVQGLLKDRWAVWLNGMVVRIENARDTTITVCVPDQAALRGILNKLWDLNLNLISVIRQDDDTDLGGLDGH